GVNDVFGTRVAPAGTILDPAGIAISTAPNGQALPNLDVGGTNYLVVWSDDRSGDYDELYGARVAPSGAVLDPAGIAISTGHQREWAPTVAFGGGTYVVAWEDERASPEG